MGVRTGVTELGVKYVEEVQHAFKSPYLFSYTLKPIYLLKQVFNRNNSSLYNIFKNICNFGAQGVWSNDRRAVSYYLYVDTSKDQYRLLNPTPLQCIVGYIMEDYIGDRCFNRLLHIRLKLIGVSISSY